jgi:hypothetical protein
MPAETDFVVQVDGVGQFTFARRKMMDEVAIQVQYAKIIDGAPATEWLQAVAGWISTLRVLTVRAPEGWDLDELDPLEDDTYAKLANVHEELRQAERSFRRKPGTAGA